MEGYLVSIGATALSLALGLSPYQTIKEIIQQRETGNVSFIPFFAICFNAAIAILYGLFVFNTLIVVVNSCVATMAVYYILVYYRFSREKGTLQVILLVGSALLAGITYNAVWRVTPEEAAFQLGVINICTCICMFASPLATLSTVIRTRNASSIPVLLSVASLACSFFWFLLGFRLGDLFIMAPNVFGMIFSTFQLFLVARYGQRKTTKIELSDV